MSAARRVPLGFAVAACALIALNTQYLGATTSSYVTYAAYTAASTVEYATSSLLGSDSGTNPNYAEEATQSALEAFGSLIGGGAGRSPSGGAAARTNGSSDAGAHACLITKWAAVWLVDVRSNTRSHVGFPSPGCEGRAAAVDDIDKYEKAHHGVGAYFLDEASSKAACQHTACGASVAAAPTASVGAGGGGSSQQAASDSLVPHLGWGAGIQSGGAWMARTRLRFNQPAQDQFKTLQLAPGEPLLLVFGGASVSDMLKNWVLHVRRIPNLPYVVACMDETLFGNAEAQGFPAVLMAGAADAAAAMGGGGSSDRVTTKWKYYRMDPKAFLQMGILKVRFFMEFMRSGFDVLCSDLDVIWMGDPRPWVLGKADASALLGLADVVVSTDVTHGHLDKDEASWGVHNELNTGMVLLRSSEGAMVFCRRWKARMELEMEKVSKLSSHMVQWWTNDQTFFNEVVHGSSTDHSADIKARSADGRQKAAAQLRAASPSKARLAQLDTALALIEGAHARGDDASKKTLRELRGLTFKRVSCTADLGARGSADVCLGRGRQVQTVTLATFPFMHFASGHTFFTQSLQERLGYTPISVHTTFQFGDTPEFTWGKRNRLREKRLWLVDDDAYYKRQGPGPDPSEASYNGFLHLTGTLVDLAEPPAHVQSSHSIKIEGHAAYATWMHKGKVSVLNLTEGNPNRHLMLDAIQRRLVMNAVALGRVLKRKVIMPRMTCWCDRYWWLLEDCRFPGVKAEQHPLPFHCPFDHVYDLEKWVHSETPFREYSFLDSPRVAPEDKADVVRLKVDGAAAEGGGAARGGVRGLHTPPHAEALRSNRTLSVAVGDNYRQVRDALAGRGWQGAFVVQIDARSLELLCENLGSPAENARFNELTHRVLGVAEQIRYCDRRANTLFDAPLKGPYNAMSNPINCTWGFHRPPQLPEREVLCSTSRAQLRDERMQEPVRRWQVQPNAGIYAEYNGEQVWSVNDRVRDLYREYV